MKIQITNKQSIYLEVAEKIDSFIKLGVFKENEKLPSCRKLALELGVNPNTIERAYSYLEEKGVIYTIPKKGIFVKSVVNKEHIFQEVTNSIRHFIDLNISKEELLSIIDKLYEEKKYD